MMTFAYDAPAMLSLLDRWAECDWLRRVDVEFSRFLQREVPDASTEILLAAALASHQLGRGHVCLDLADVLADPLMSLSLPPEQDADAVADPVIQPDALFQGIQLDAWLRGLNHEQLIGDGVGSTPLVRSGHRIYLRRYWRYERQVEAAIADRLAASGAIESQLPPADFRSALDQLFPPVAGTTNWPNWTNWQKVACALAARSAFSIVTGGPGTGKTTTVVRLLALLQRMALSGKSARPLEIRLAAPTGKAAARLRKSISDAIADLPKAMLADPTLRAAIPADVTTLHRLLGPRPDSRRFRHDARNPLPLDVLVVDEASMVDLEMMSAVLTALPRTARLILLGDKDQLASVEAGSVLGQLCRRAIDGHYTPETARWVAQMTGETVPAELIRPDGQPLDQCVVMLRHSHRFNAESGIGQLAAAVNGGLPEPIDAVWRAGYPDLLRYDLPRIDDARLASLVLGTTGAEPAQEGPRGYAAYLSEIRRHLPAIDADRAEFDAWAKGVLSAHGRFQLLCALRSGPYGVSGMNQRIETLLRQRGLIDAEEEWYLGRPVIVTRNDYGLGLMNGDIGITLRFPVRDRQSGEPRWGTRVAFPKTDGSGGIRWVLPSRLLSVDTVFALTVHKSQGSEFEHCALLLPPRRNPVLTRELVYTGITRAKRWFSLISVGNPDMVKEASGRSIQRAGGLFAENQVIETQ